MTKHIVTQPIFTKKIKENLAVFFFILFIVLLIAFFINMYYLDHFNLPIKLFWSCICSLFLGCSFGTSAGHNPEYKLSSHHEDNAINTDPIYGYLPGNINHHTYLLRHDPSFISPTTTNPSFSPIQSHSYHNPFNNL